LDKIKPSNKTEIWILNIERGLSLLIKTHHNDIIIYDLGSNEELSPLELFEEKKLFSELNKRDRLIDQVIISHPHSDHISDLNDANTSFIRDNAELVTCQNDKDEGQKLGHKINFDRINNQSSAVLKVNNYKSLYEKRNLPLVTFVNPNKSIIPNLKIGYYYITHNQADNLFKNDDQKYTNSLSIVLLLRHGKNSILIPGDITPEAMDLILADNCEKRFTDYSIIQSEEEKETWSSKTSDQPSLKSLLEDEISFIIAPHHGLESGYSENLFDIIGDNLPDLILISEKRKGGKNEGSTHINYQNGKCSKGVRHNKKIRYSLSTMNDGHVRITLLGNSYKIKTSSEIEEIFND
jgi:beta-lactamase superfamily II metal-dependent hydrolase